jgi:hypothetical protein
MLRFFDNQICCYIYRHWTGTNTFGQQLWLTSAVRGFCQTLAVRLHATRKQHLWMADFVLSTHGSARVSSSTLSWLVECYYDIQLRLGRSNLEQ